jgi:carbon monoxide dehydrogenase subunit G
VSVTIEARVDVDAPPEVVWEAVTDWPAQREWVPGTVVGVTSGDGRSAGSTLWAFTGLADVGFLDTMEIVEWQPPRRCRVRHLGRLLRGHGEFAVEPRGGNATLVWTEELDPPLGPIGWLGLRLGRPVFQAGLRRAARNFAVWCVNPR